MKLPRLPATPTQPQFHHSSFGIVSCCYIWKIPRMLPRNLKGSSLMFFYLWQRCTSIRMLHCNHSCPRPDTASTFQKVEADWSLWPSGYFTSHTIRAAAHTSAATLLLARDFRCLSVQFSSGCAWLITCKNDAISASFLSFIHDMFLKMWDLFLCPLNLSCPCNLLCQAECSRGDMCLTSFGPSDLYNHQEKKPS